MELWPEHVPLSAGYQLIQSKRGTQTDTRLKTEVVLLLTPRVVRNFAVPDASLTRLASGVDAQPGAYSSLLRREAGVRVGSTSGGAMPRPRETAPMATAGPQRPQQAPPSEVVLKLDVTPQISVGGMASIALKSEIDLSVKGELEFDATRLVPTRPLQDSVPGRYPVKLTPRGERVVMLRALPPAAGQVLNIGLSGLSATGASGE